MVKPVLQINSGAWWKLSWLGRTSKTEVSGIGIMGLWPQMRMTDFRLVGQIATDGTTKFTHDGWFDHQEKYGDAKIDVNVYSRVWVHTHPGQSATPSSVDRETWETQFGVFPWAIMLIVARGGQWHCEIRVKEPNIVSECDVQIYDGKYVADTELWIAEREALVAEPKVEIVRPENVQYGDRRATWMPTLRWFATATAADVQNVISNKARYNDPQNWRWFKEFLPDILWYAHNPGEWWAYDRTKLTGPQLEIFDRMQSKVAAYQDKNATPTMYAFRMSALRRALSAAVRQRQRDDDGILLLTAEDHNV